MNLKVGALFAGYGGIELALASVLDTELTWYAELDKGPASVMAHHHPDVPNLWDVTKVDWSTVEPVDVITGGSPCQDLSHAGKRKGMRVGTRSGLWASMCDAVDIIRPRLVVWENVQGALSAEADSELEPCPRCVGDPRDRGPVLRALGRVLGDLSELGYDARWYGLRAADVGAAHGRFRIFLFATPADANSAGRFEHGWPFTVRPQQPAPQHAGADAAGLSLGRMNDGYEMTLHGSPAVTETLRLRSEVMPDGCHVWTEWTNSASIPYGKFSIGNRKFYAHRAAYELAYGPIPDGHEIDHLCQNSLCVNPDHLEAVTPGENRDRVTQRRTHCKRGHEFTEENTYWVREGARACKACRGWQDKVQKARKRGAPEPEPPLLPTPVTNDMGEGKTPEHWDAWTDRMRAEHGNGNGHGKSLAIEAQRLLPTPRTENNENRQSEGYGGNRGNYRGLITGTVPWGDYAAAIARWETVIGRPAPDPTEPNAKGGHRLSARFVEWLMGLPEGHVTDVPGMTRNVALKCLGNGVVPAQAAAALRAFLADSIKEATHEAV